MLPNCGLFVQLVLATRVNSVTVSSTEVNLSLNGSIIPNHGYVPISSIPLNSNDDTALLCHTNRPPRNNYKDSDGNWFIPSGTSVGNKVSTAVPGFVRNKGPMEVRLKRTNGAAPEGIYWCSVKDDLLTPWTVYVGLYNKGKGSFSLTKQAIRYLLLQEVFHCLVT